MQGIKLSLSDIYIKFLLPLVLVPGIILRGILALISPGGGGTETLKTLAVHSFFANTPEITFSHIPLSNRLFFCSPFYTYISYVIFGMQTFFRNVFPDMWADPQQGERIFNLFLRFPAIFADLGIALIIFYMLRGKLKDEKKAVCGSALYFWLPPLIFAEMRRPFVLPVSALFLLTAVALSEKRGKGWAIATGLSTFPLFSDGSESPSDVGSCFVDSGHILYFGYPDDTFSRWKNGDSE